MCAFFTRPNPEKNVFQNYVDRLECLHFQYRDKLHQLENHNTLERKVIFLFKEALNQLTMFEQLRDVHDYFDEILGVLVVPTTSVLASIVTLAISAWEGIQALAISAGCMNDDRENHSGMAQTYLLLSGACLLASLGSLLKSVISLITRPIVTAIKGFGKMDIDRFHNDNAPFENYLSEVIDTLSTGLKDLYSTVEKKIEEKTSSLNLN